jgi:arginine dihydrolase
MQRLMCRPTYFDVEYSINPWMDVRVPVDRELASDQWKDLRDLLAALGDDVEVIDGVPGLLDMTFAGDAGFVYGNTFVPSNFRHPERQGETEHYERWFRERGYTVRPMPSDVIFEGLGDVVFYGSTAITGHGPRSDTRALACLHEIVPSLDVVASMEIVDDRYFHLAMALAFIDDSTVVYYPPAFTSESVDQLGKAIPNAIAVSEEDANDYFACNNLVISDKVVLDGSTAQLQAALARYGYEVVTCPMSEFKKSGGSLRCLVLSFVESTE